MGGLAAATAFIGLVGSTDAALAAPPPNDNFAAAQVLAGEQGVVMGTNLEATLEPGEPRHLGEHGEGSVWYRWTAPRDGGFGFTTRGSNFDTVLAVYTGGDLTMLAAVAADDDSGVVQAGTGRASAVAFRAIGGTTYHIAVAGYEDERGRIVLAWTPAPGNDDFRNAYPLSGPRGLVRGTNRFATREPGEPGPGGASVWYRWTAPRDGVFGFTTRGSNFNTSLAVYTGGDLTMLAAVAANDDVGWDIASAVGFRAIGGVTYRIAVAGSQVVGGRIVLTWGPAPRNDDFRNAYRVSGRRGHAGGTNRFATRQRGEPLHGGASVWYRWRAPRTRRMAVTTAGSNFDTLLSIYTGTSVRSLRAVGRDDDGGVALTSVVRFQAIAGRVYRIAVAGYGGAIGRTRLAWRPAPPTRVTGSFG